MRDGIHRFPCLLVEARYLVVHVFHRIGNKWCREFLIQRIDHYIKFRGHGVKFIHRFDECSQYLLTSKERLLVLGSFSLKSCKLQSHHVKLCHATRDGGAIVILLRHVGHQRHFFSHFEVLLQTSRVVFLESADTLLYVCQIIPKVCFLEHRIDLVRPVLRLDKTGKFLILLGTEPNALKIILPFRLDFSEALLELLHLADRHVVLRVQFVSWVRGKGLSYFYWGLLLYLKLFKEQVVVVFQRACTGEGVAIVVGVKDLLLHHNPLSNPAALRRNEEKLRLHC
mmetsp:Transcript_279/g.355  ORF Transcript_279/g.355 Transcript_279/m.355 type:complete len:283 (-) Transcript_279:1466-2314(-)